MHPLRRAWIHGSCLGSAHAVQTVSHLQSNCAQLDGDCIIATLLLNWAALLPPALRGTLQCVNQFSQRRLWSPNSPRPRVRCCLQYTGKDTRGTCFNTESRVSNRKNPKIHVHKRNSGEEIRIWLRQIFLKGEGETECGLNRSREEVHCGHRFLGEQVQLSRRKTVGVSGAQEGAVSGRGRDAG